MKRALLILPVLLLASPVAAQQQKGDVELEFTGSLITTVGADQNSGIGIIQSKVGRFVTDRIELGAYPSLETRFVGNVSVTTVGFGLFGVYSFLQEDAMTVPYVGFFYYKSDVTEGFEANDNWLGVNGGFKVYVSPRMALDIGGNYLFGVSGQEGGLVMLLAGLSFLL